MNNIQVVGNGTVTLDNGDIVLFGMQETFRCVVCVCLCQQYRKSRNFYNFSNSKIMKFNCLPKVVVLAIRIDLSLVLQLHDGLCKTAVYATAPATFIMTVAIVLYPI